MESGEIRKRFLTFFEKRGHSVIPSASLVPENDASVLFTTAGMHPLVPYLLGKEHPKGKRLVDVQKCVRTGDLDDVGDNRHFTFFEMLGNWSLGDYFKEDAIKWSYEFLTSKEEGLDLDPSKLYVTVFEGNDDAPFDDESKKTWMSLGIPEHRIYALGAEDNWWSAGDSGPCGPDTEMFYDLTNGLGDLNKDDFLSAVKREDVVEIWNDVFMEFRKENGKVVERLNSKNVDTGAGLERMTSVMQGRKTAYDTDLFKPLFDALNRYESASSRIIVDHMRAAVFMVSDDVVPSNTDAGYVLRRLLRRAYLHVQKLDLGGEALLNVAKAVMSHPTYTNSYKFDEPKIINVIETEINKFMETLKDGLKQFEKGEDPFVLFTTYGFPFELTKELAKDKGLALNEEDFKQKFVKHQELSRAGAEQKFKGGLAGHSEVEVRYHTATHLLHQALRDVLGTEVSQKGSNITTERLRFDFSFPRKMTDNEKKRVEEIVNRKIEESILVENVVMSKDEAVKLGALHFFDQKYPDQVSVYKIGEYSKEFCGGPHVKNTKEIGKLKIEKEEAVSAGVRRIKATIQ